MTAPSAGLARPALRQLKALGAKHVLLKALFTFRALGVCSIADRAFSEAPGQLPCTALEHRGDPASVHLVPTTGVVPSVLQLSEESQVLRQSY